MISVYYSWVGHHAPSNQSCVNMFYKNDDVSRNCDFCFIFKTQYELNNLLISRGRGKYKHPRSTFTQELQTIFYSDEEFAELLLEF